MLLLLTHPIDFFLVTFLGWHQVFPKIVHYAALAGRDSGRANRQQPEPNHRSRWQGDRCELRNREAQTLPLDCMAVHF
jgi:hypothetical protein